MGSAGASIRYPHVPTMASVLASFLNHVKPTASHFRMSTQLSRDDFTVTGPSPVMVDSPIFKSYSKRLRFCGAV